MSTVDVLTKNGIVDHAAELVAAATKVGLQLHIAAAFIEQESHGRNVYGNDAGGAMRGAGPVTQANYRTFLKLVRGGHTSNGVGPAQLTYPGHFIPDTAEVAGLWQPEPNMVFGFKLIKGYLGGKATPAAINNAGQIYNGGHPGAAPEYGGQVQAKAARWLTLLGAATASPKPVAKPKPASGKAALPVLRKGSKGAQVKSLQAFLLRAYPAYAGPIKKAGGADGQFGAGTAAVVKEFQHRSHLVADAIVGPSTWAALKKAGMSV